MLVLANAMFSSPPVFAWFLPVFVRLQPGKEETFSPRHGHVFFVFSTWSTSKRRLTMKEPGGKGQGNPGRGKGKGKGKDKEVEIESPRVVGCSWFIGLVGLETELPKIQFYLNQYCSCETPLVPARL